MPQFYFGCSLILFWLAIMALGSGNHNNNIATQWMIHLEIKPYLNCCIWQLLNPQLLTPIIHRHKWLIHIESVWVILILFLRIFLNFSSYAFREHQQKYFIILSRFWLFLCYRGCGDLIESIIEKRNFVTKILFRWYWMKKF